MQDGVGGYARLLSTGPPSRLDLLDFSLSFTIWISKYFLLVQSLKLRN